MRWLFTVLLLIVACSSATEPESPDPGGVHIANPIPLEECVGLLEAYIPIKEHFGEEEARVRDEFDVIQQMCQDEADDSYIPLQARVTLDRLGIINLRSELSNLESQTGFSVYYRNRCFWFIAHGQDGRLLGCAQ